MSLAAFTWTTRARPFVEVGIGDSRTPAPAARWDVQRWDAADALWSGVDPSWLDVTCDARSFDCEYGRARTTDRFVPGVASVIVDNSSGWADPGGDPTPGVLNMRPGRSIRMGVDHELHGRQILFRGFVDAMNPTYDPVDADTVELVCIDALGEVNRAKLVPASSPVGAGDTADVRVARLLDLVGWATAKRDLDASSLELVGDELGGQVADLLGQAAESGGGSVFGDYNASVVFRGRDWQTFVPDVPVDATIGNVEPGHIVPGTPEVPGYFIGDGTATHYVSTPDANDLVMDGDVRWTCRVRDDSTETTTSRLITAKQDRNAARLDYRLGHTYLTGTNVTGYPTGLASPQIVAAVGVRSAIGTTPPGADVYIGADLVGVNPGSQALTLRGQFLRSTDGTTWTNVGALGAAVRADTLSYNGPDPLNVGLWWLGRIYWSQIETRNRARLVFPGVVGNYLGVPDAANLDITGDVEIVARLTFNDIGATNQGVVSKHGAYTLYLNVATAVGAIFFFADAPGTSVFASSTSHGFVSGQTYWVKMTRAVATGLVSFYKANDSPTEPTTWTAIGTQTPAGSAGKTIAVSAYRVDIGQRYDGALPFTGRIARGIVRNGIAGTVVLDVSENNAGKLVTATTFVATTGQTVTISTTPPHAIVQPQPDRVVWRFDANDYPGTGTSYVDPRGRTWTLSAAGAIVPKVPEVPPVVVPADVCPIGWERPFARADIATRVIIGRDLQTAQVLDDADAQVLYGIEPFERTDLLTANDAEITSLGTRILVTRSAATAPRIRAVSFDARTADNVLDLLSTVDVYRPSRYRCRLRYPRGDVFDKEMFATGVAHHITPGAWTLELNLDVAEPFAAAGGRWDRDRWDRAAWTVAP